MPRGELARGILAVVAVLVFSGGCGRPSKANTELRKQNQALRNQVAELQGQLQLANTHVRSLEEAGGSLPTLPLDRLQKLYTAHDLELGRSTGGADLDPSRPGDEGIKVYVAPVDSAGDALKAAGRFVVELFDLSVKDKPLLGHWTFDAEQTRKMWYGGALLDRYILTCPWQRVPEREELTVRVTFFDELTQQELPVVQKVIRVSPPPAASTRQTAVQ